VGIVPSAITVGRWSVDVELLGDASGVAERVVVAARFDEPSGGREGAVWSARAARGLALPHWAVADGGDQDGTEAPLGPTPSASA
jgi:hypothetical protein